MTGSKWVDRVTSLMKFYIADKQCDVYDYGGVIVSGSHLVFEEGRPTRVEDSFRANPSSEES